MMAVAMLLVVVMVSAIVAAIAVVALLIDITATLFFYATVIMVHFMTFVPGSRPLVVAYGRCCRLLLHMHRINIFASDDATLEQCIVNLLPFLKEIRSRW